MILHLRQASSNPLNWELVYNGTIHMISVTRDGLNFLRATFGTLAHEFVRDV